MKYRLVLMLMACCLSLTACAVAGKKSLLGDKSESLPPKLLAPSVKKIWIPSQLKDGGQEWEEGHYVYRIERGTSWSR